MTTPTSGIPALALSDIELHYGFVRALDGIDVHVMPGEVVALLGDNGAGKSTLLKVMSGAHRPSHGAIRVHGVEQSFSAPSDAAAAGIQMVYQDLALVEPQDISTNLNMGTETLRRGPLGWLGFVDRKAMRKSSEAELDRLGVRTAPMTRPVEMPHRIVILNRGKKVADVPAAGTDRDHVVGWITGSRASMYADQTV